MRLNRAVFVVLIALVGAPVVYSSADETKELLFGVTRKVPGKVLSAPGDDPEFPVGTELTLKEWDDGTWTIDGGGYINKRANVTEGAGGVFLVKFRHLPDWDFEFEAD